jgi:L-asparagine transporter-like permease
VTTRIVFFSSSTSTKPSRNSPNTLPYIVFILLFVILCAAVSVLIAYIFCCRRKRQKLIGQMSSTLSDTTKTDANNIAINDSDGTRSTSNTRTISSSLLPTQSNERTSSNKYIGRMFDDKNF